MGHSELDPQEDLLNYFERVSGKGLRTKADLDQYLAYAQEVRPPLWLHVNRVPRGWALVKQLVLALLFAGALVQFVYIDMVVEIASLRQTIYFVSSNKS